MINAVVFSIFYGRIHSYFIIDFFRCFIVWSSLFSLNRILTIRNHRLRLLDWFWGLFQRFFSDILRLLSFFILVLLLLVCLYLLDLIIFVDLSFDYVKILFICLTILFFDLFRLILDFIFFDQLILIFLQLLDHWTSRSR